MDHVTGAAGALFVLLAGAGSAQPVVPAPPAMGAGATPVVAIAPPAPIEVAQGKVVLAKGTRVTLTLEAPVGSDISQPGDRFPIRLAEPLVVDGKLVMAAGATGGGEVVHAAKARWGGKAGELIVNARFLDCNGVRVPLGKMKFAETGEDKRVGAMAATMVLLPAAFFISGGKVEVPPGTRADASIIGDVELVAGAEGRCGGTSDAKGE